VVSDRIAAVVILVGAIAYVRMARDYHGLTVADIVGPSAYPYIIGTLMALLALALFARARPKPAEGTFWTRHGKALVLAASLYAYLRLLEPAGFLLSTFAYTSFGHLWLGERSWIRATALSASVTIGLWFLFNRVFDLNLPAGFLEWPR
jgi:putative tricarboxylic transport membrane protein